MGEATSRRIVAHTRSLLGAGQKRHRYARAHRWPLLICGIGKSPSVILGKGGKISRVVYVEADLRERKYTIEQAENLKGSRTRSKMILQSWTRTY